jgi:hypothetical protein
MKYVGDRQVYRFGWNIQTLTLDSHQNSWYVPDFALIQFFLLMMSTVVLETCRELEEIYMKKELRGKLVIYKKLTEMHGQQNIKKT